MTANPRKVREPVALDVDRIRQLAAEAEDAPPPMTAEQAEAAVRLLAVGASRRRRSA